MPIFILIMLVGAVIVGGLALADNSGSSSGGDDNTLLDPTLPPPTLNTNNVFNTPDCAPETQGGSWKTDYDAQFLASAQKYNLPFALLKAHAIRESALNPSAFRLEPSGKASYGLMQILWWQNSGRFAKWGYSDDSIGDGSLLYDPIVNTDIACRIIIDNYSRMPQLRDCINAYNTGVKVSVRAAPGNYVNDVLANFSKLVGTTVS